MLVRLLPPSPLLFSVVSTLFSVFVLFLLLLLLLVLFPIFFWRLHIGYHHSVVSDFKFLSADVSVVLFDQLTLIRLLYHLDWKVLDLLLTPPPLLFHLVSLFPLQ